MNPNIFAVQPIIDRVMNYVSQTLLSLPSEFAFWVNNLNWIEQKILYPYYQTSCQSHTQQLDIQSLPQLDRQIIAGLTEQGVYVTSLEELGLPNTEEFLEAAAHVTQELSDRARIESQARTHTLTASAQQLMEHRAIFDWGISNRLLTIIEGYLGLPVAYDGLSFYYSVADGQIAGPRRWHRDREDWRMVKVAVYLTDVDPNSGPFECVTPEVNAELLQQIKPKYRRFNNLNEQEISFEGDGFKSCTGKAGTVIFADTALYYHRGRPPVDRDRSAVFFSYFSQSPKNPFFCGRSPLSDQELRSLSSSLPENLQVAVRWKDHLSGLGKYIPKNRLKV